MKRLSLLIVALLFLPLASAWAADLELPFKTPAGAFSWTGFYVGGNAGGAWGNEQVSQTFTAPAPFLAVDTAAISSSASQTFRPGSATAGGQAGYNYQWGNWVVGGEVDFEYLGVRGFNSGNFPFPSTLPGGAAGPPTAFFNTATSVSADWLFTARPRIGWATDEWLLYVTGGLAVGRESFSQTIAILAPFVETSSLRRPAPAGPPASSSSTPSPAIGRSAASTYMSTLARSTLRERLPRHFRGSPLRAQFV